MARAPAILLLLSAALASAPVAAAPAPKSAPSNNGSGLYKWVDGNGRVYYSSVVPPDASKAQINKLTKDGRVQSVSEAELSREQRAQRELKARKREQMEKVRKQEELRIQALEQRYLGIAELEEDIRKTRHSWAQKMDPFTKRLVAIEGHIARNRATNGSAEELASLRNEHESIVSQMVLIKSESDLQVSRMTEDPALWKRKKAVAGGL